ncbi:hypothetical protein GGX14DRAFT_461451 [Mycena pura]|uniref:MYND-type domain-containing protein n=1 Tax=Mycena pura TaxID=153505 RepID=A0AAD6Y9A9_9AGAR|nr:hypothetical protein GGX14DRAFT_461451 [Mycena pura]
MHPSLRLDNTFKLPEPLKTLAISAANGSLDDLAQLHDLIPDTPQSQLCLVIPALYANLNLSDISDLRAQLEIESFSSVVQSGTKKAILALKGICELEKHLISRAYGEIWASAWEWIQFLDDCDKRREGETGASSSELRMLYIAVISSLSNDADTLSTIKRTPGVRKYFGKGWVVVVDQLQPADELFRKLCDFSIQHVNAKDTANLQELIDGAGGIPEFAALMVKHIRCAVPHKQHTPSPHDGFALLAVFVLLQQTDLFHGPLREPLVTYGIVECLAVALHALCGPEMLLTEQLIPMCFGVLYPSISTFPGFPWFKQALDNGLLRALVLCACRRQQILQTPLHWFLREPLLEMLVYHSVLSSLRPVLDEAKDLADSPGFRSSEYAREWDTFVALATERLAVMERYDSGALCALRACDNVECSAMRKDDELLRCTACRNAFYCSRECQAADWASGHRKLCKNALNRVHEKCPQLTFRDRDFLRALVHSDYLAHRNKLLLMHANFLRGNDQDGAPFFVQFDYRKGFVSMDTGAVPGGMAEYAARATRSGGRVELHVVVVKEGTERPRAHVIPLRSADGRVLAGLKAMARGEYVAPESPEMALSALDSAQTH